MARGQAFSESTGPSARERKHGWHRRLPGRLLGGYWFELCALVLLGVGIFLLVERMKIKTAVYRFLVACVRSLGSALNWLWERILYVSNEVEKSDIVGVILVIVALWMIAHRSRLRAITRHPDMDQLEGCPRCGGELRRVKRTLASRLTGLLLWVSVRCYECAKCTFRHSSWQKRSWNR
jgi:hypothetical protein